MKKNKTEIKDELKKAHDEILESLEILHAANFIHGDIKSNNIVKCDDRYKLIDYGLSGLANDESFTPTSIYNPLVRVERKKHDVDTPNPYTKTELFQKYFSTIKSSLSNIDKSYYKKYVDKFSLAFTLYELNANVTNEMIDNLISYPIKIRNKEFVTKCAAELGLQIGTGRVSKKMSILLMSKNVKELRQLASIHNVVGRSKMNKHELVFSLRGVKTL